MTYYRRILVIASVALIYTGWTNYYCMYNKEPNPSQWAMLFGLLSLPLLTRQQVISDLLKSPLMVWCFGYAWLTVTWFLLSSQSDMASQDVRWRALAIFQLLMFLALFADPDANKLARRTLVAAVLFGVAMNIYEVFVPMTFSRFAGRSAGLYLNANQSGEALVCGMILSVTAMPSRYRTPFMLLTGIGVFVTFSRGGILTWLIAVAGLILTGRVGLKNLFVSGFLGLVLVGLVLLPRLDQLLTTLERSGTINKDVQERLAWLADPSGVSDASSLDRLYLAKQAWEKIAEHPLLGGGTGASHTAPDVAFYATHNQYLALMEDHGLLGAAIMPLLILAMTWGAYGDSRHVAKVFGCAVLLTSFFSHAVLYAPSSLWLFSLMAAMASTSRESEMKGTMAIATVEVGTPKTLVRA